ncbi:MAG: endonuclease/exonuclease/phosphatase, partial [Niabella sp.]|nr:endonuclease/exonuclease/phosphatase [Niabella sp.]
IVNWNIEWFGSAEFKGNLDQQEANVGKVLKYLGADLFGICEVVDTARFGRMIRQYLGAEFAYVISPYPAIEQKLAFVYNKNIFRKAQARPFMALSATAYSSFASGRFPFLFTAEVTVNDARKKVSFVLIHAKADKDMNAYTKRFNGAVELKDSMDTYLKNENGMILGDYNDNLAGSISSGQPSPYQNFLNDDIHYVAITLPLNTGGYQSTINYANSVIDQQIVSGALKQWYLNHSAKIRTDVAIVIPDYTSNTTSDHYPVSSVYRITN